MQKAFLVAAAMLCASLAVCHPLMSGQEAPAPKTDEPSPIERDIAARKKSFLSQKGDLETMGKSVTGPDVQVILALDEKAGHAALELDATLWFLTLYDNMQCEQDREVAKTALKNRLGFYSHILGLEADQVPGQLAFSKLPTTAQAGQRLKDDLRAARDKLDEINVLLK